MNLDALHTIIEHRKADSPANSYTARLLSEGVDRIGKKVGEEATELVIAAKNGLPEEIAHEAADLFYHTLVLLEATGVPLDDIYEELDRRHTPAPQPPDGTAADRGAE